MVSEVNSQQQPQDPLNFELHPPLSAHQALIASERCYFCYDAPCTTACPTGIDIPLFIRQISTGNSTNAARTIFSENILGGLCARVCPVETLCEEACVRNTSEDKPVQIGLLQRFATDSLMASGHQPAPRAAESGKRVAVVGSGPAGLSCAHRLARLGHQVMIFDQQEKPGGLNEYGIAAFKVPDDFAQLEIDYLMQVGGITLSTGISLGGAVTLDELCDQYDAVFLGIGLGAGRVLDIDNAAAAGVVDAIKLISAVRQRNTTLVDPGRKVIVIGGGMTAIDAAVQSRLLGASDVTIAYRGSRANMKASDLEVELALSHGVRVLTDMQPVAIQAEAGTVIGMRFDHLGQQTELPADRVVVAIGQNLTQAVPGVTLQHGRIRVDEHLRTSRERVWAGGDCIGNGLDLSVAAVQDGKLAAESIHQTLQEC